MASSSSKLRNTCYFPIVLLLCLNLVLFILASTSLAPILLLKNPPTSLGWALLLVSCISILSSLVGFFSQLTHMCFITHISLVLASSISQMLGISALFTREKSSIQSIESSRDPKEAMLLIRVECGALIAMFIMQLSVMVITCAVHCCWAEENRGFEAERETKTRKRRRNSRVQEGDSMANAAETGEVRAKDLDEKTKNKNGQLVKTQIVNKDFEG